MKILILGHGEHGKDTAAEIITELTGLRFESSSLAASDLVVWPHMPQYGNAQECFEDRRNHREKWKQLITEYNTPDKSKLCRQILSRCDGYIGMRCQDEYKASRDFFNFVFWVDASVRKGIDPTMKICFDYESMIYIDNNDSLKILKIRIMQKLLDAGIC